jgi:hypothetical protein
MPYACAGRWVVHEARHWRHGFGQRAGNRSKTKGVMMALGKLDRLTKEVIAAAVSALKSCVLTRSAHFRGTEAGPE